MRSLGEEILHPSVEPDEARRAARPTRDIEEKARRSELQPAGETRQLIGGRCIEVYAQVCLSLISRVSSITVTQCPVSKGARIKSGVSLLP